MTEELQAADTTPPPQDGWRVAAWLMPRAVALCFVIAFWSWGLQCVALVGSDGILPAEQLMQAIEDAEARDGRSYFFAMPTVFRFGCSDGLLLGACWLGAVLAVLALAGVIQGWALFGAWVLYLSLVTAGQTFMSFQWDALLLEAAIVALFLSSWRRWWGWRVEQQPSRAGIFLFHWLVFRLMLLSGAVKLWGGDEVWENGTALLHHFETQPLPSWIGWWAHQMPRDLLVWACWGMYVVELVFPFTQWLGRWGRLSAALGYVALMIGVALTGSYNFFNLLTALLALSLVQDRWWPASFKKHILSDGPASMAARWCSVCRGLAAAAIVLFSLVAADSFLAGRVRGYTARAPETLSSFHGRWVAPFSSINAYGLFQDMTEERLEVEVEVSEDGATFFPLRFWWKPGDSALAPRFAAPHQPRLDWQMWFAALSGGFLPQRDGAGGPMQWFGSFLHALANGKLGVWALVDEEQTLVKRHHVVAARSSLWRYHFTTREQRLESGDWWQREYLGSFSPTFRRRETTPDSVPK